MNEAVPAIDGVVRTSVDSRVVEFMTDASATGVDTRVVRGRRATPRPDR